MRFQIMLMQGAGFEIPNHVCAKANAMNMKKEEDNANDDKEVKEELPWRR